MGMFDTIKFDDELMAVVVEHLGPQQEDEEDFQTKWFGCNLDIFHVDDNGQITVKSRRTDFGYGDPNNPQFTDGHFGFYFLNNSNLVGYIVNNKLKYVTTWVEWVCPIIEISCAEYIVIPTGSSEHQRISALILGKECSLVGVEETDMQSELRLHQAILIEDIDNATAQCTQHHVIVPK